MLGKTIAKLWYFLCVSTIKFLPRIPLNLPVFSTSQGQASKRPWKRDKKKKDNSKKFKHRIFISSYRTLGDERIKGLYFYGYYNSNVSRCMEYFWVERKTVYYISEEFFLYKINVDKWAIHHFTSQNEL